MLQTPESGHEVGIETKITKFNPDFLLIQKN